MLMHSPDTQFYPHGGRCTQRWHGRGLAGHSHRLALAYSPVADPQYTRVYKDHTCMSPDDTHRAIVEMDISLRWQSETYRK